MPKVTIEYTDNINPNDLNLSAMIDEMHTALGACETMGPERVTIMCHPVSHYSLLDRRSYDGGILITVAYIAGRPLELQATFGKACVNTAQKYVNAMNTDLKITVKGWLTEMETTHLVAPD